MKFGLLNELQYPKPWVPGGELELFQNTLQQCELADEVGLDYIWNVEHHFLEEYAHSSAPEVFLGALARGTKHIRLGHGITLMPPGYNHPARVAERIATLDLVSNGRVEFGAGESSSRAELDGFGVALDKKRSMFLEATEQVANMLAMDPYPGYDGEHFSMPTRNIVPKPVQRPHPPMWMACSNHQAIHTAAELGLGALTFAFVPPEKVKPWIDDYYETIKTNCNPIGHTVNANVAVVTTMHMDRDQEKAWERGVDGNMFFQLALAHHYVFGTHKPGRTDLWEQYMSVQDLLRPMLRKDGGISAVGDPAHVRWLLDEWTKAGADQVMMVAQSGKTRHRDVMNSIEMFAEEVMPRYHQDEEAREERKARDLGPYIKAALDRKAWMKPLGDAEIPLFEAYNRPVADLGTRPRGREVAEDNWQIATKKLMSRAGVVPPHAPSVPPPSE